MNFISNLISQAHLPLPMRMLAEYNKDIVLRMVCALLNGEGGWIVLGISAEKEVIGVPDVYDELQFSITNLIVPTPLVYIQLESYSGKMVYLLTVMKGNLGPYTYRGLFYIVDEDDITSPTSEQLSVMLHSKDLAQDKWELKTCMQAEVSDLDTELMKDVYNKGKARKRVIQDKEESLLATLRRLCLVSSSSISNGAMSLLGKQPSIYLNQCRVRIQVMLNGKTAEQYEDYRNFEGNLFTLHNHVMKYFEDLPHTVFFADPTGYRAENYRYPLEVIDEAITNALIHRSYNGFLDEITIFIYRDRVEIANPGEMLGRFIINGKVISHSSVLRNPTMAEVFYMSGLMEKSGRGLSLIYDSMLEAGYKKPVWKTENGNTILTIYSVLQKKTFVNDRMCQFLKECAIGMVFSKVEYMRRFPNISKITAQTDIQKLVELGFCVQKGNGPKSSYLVKKI